MKLTPEQAIQQKMQDWKEGTDTFQELVAWLLTKRMRLQEAAYFYNEMRLHWSRLNKQEKAQMQELCRAIEMLMRLQDQVLVAVEDTSEDYDIKRYYKD